MPPRADEQGTKSLRPILIMFDFSRFIGGETTRPVEFIGLSEAQTKDLVEGRCPFPPGVWSCGGGGGVLPGVIARLQAYTVARLRD